MIALSGAATAEDNAIAHERNVRFVLDAMDLLGVATTARNVLFADGNDPGSDVHFEEPEPAARRRLYAMGLLRVRDARARDALSRLTNNTLPNADRADLETLRRLLRADAVALRETRDPEPLLLYVTDHGRETPRHDNSYIVLWGDHDIDVRAMGELLDAQPTSRRIVTVMSQCYSGAFASLVHRHGDPRLPIAEHDRCGFFAAPADRPSAGCTPETDESQYDDYTTWFFAALSGRDRTGHPIADADRDRDGRTSFSEAHRYALLHDDTTDVPVSSSEEFLRSAYARWLVAERSRRIPIGQWLARARPQLREIARSLLDALGIDDRVTAATLEREARHRRLTCAPALCEALDALDAARAEAHRTLREAVLAHRVPGVTSLEVSELPIEAADALVQASQPYLAAIEGLEATTDLLIRIDDRDEARIERVRRLVELAALEAHAREIGGEVLAAYERIQRCEDDSVAR